MTVFILHGSNENSYQVFGVFSTKDEAEKNKNKLKECSNKIIRNYKLNIQEEELDDDSLVNFFFNE